MPDRILSQKPFLSHYAAFSFFTGILAGTIWVNRTGAALPGALGAGGYGLLTGWSGPALTEAAGVVSGLSALPALFLKRGLLAGILWLMGMSLLAVPGTLFFLAWLGFSMAFLISCMTIQSGIGGVLLFLASVFPQIVFYLPVGMVLSIWGLNGRQRLHLAGFLILLVVTAAGAAAELLINPVLMSLLYNRLR